MSDRPDWDSWILQKNAEAKEEELKKGVQKPSDAELDVRASKIKQERPLEQPKKRKHLFLDSKRKEMHYPKGPVAGEQSQVHGGKPVQAAIDRAFREQDDKE